MTKPIKGKFKISFTPCADWLIEQYDLETSATFGRIWRYSLQKGFCHASISTIAKELGLSYKTVQVRIKKLREDDLIKDHSENLKNHPHTYSINWKTVLEIHTKYELAIEQKNRKEVEDKQMTELRKGVASANLREIFE
jgi:DNA-binding Lrp family transcriptional regulator